MDANYQTLLQLQELDKEIERAEERLAEFEPKLENIDAPVEGRRRGVESVRSRLADVKKEARRLERGAEEKRHRLEQFEKRLDRVRNAREEAAARTELDLISRAIETDEEEAVETMDQVTRLELKLEELEEKLQVAEDEVEPARRELLDERAEVEQSITDLKARRQQQMGELGPTIRELYKRLSSGRSGMVLASLTGDGACGHCFSMIPLQKQTELRRSDEIHRCEACGVILYAEAEA